MMKIKEGRLLYKTQYIHMKISSLAIYIKVVVAQRGLMR